MPDTTPASVVAPLLIALTLLLGASGCGDDSVGESAPDAAPTTTAATTPTSTATPTNDGATTDGASTGASTGASATPPFPTGTGPVDGGYGSGNGLGLTGVRTAHRSGYDRVVFDLGGQGRPGFYVRYATRPRADGSGDPVRLEGTAFVQVVLRGMGLPDDTGIAPYGDATTRVPGSRASRVSEIAPGGVFEGDQLAYIGLRGDRTPLRAFTLTNPHRVVVDVRDE